MNASIRAEYGRKRRALIAASALMLAACAHRPVVPEEAAGRAAVAYAGLAVGESSEGGALVLDVVAGPAALAGLQPADRIVSVGSENVDAARFLDIVRSSRPGAKLLLGILRQGQLQKMELVVGDLEEWASPAYYPSRVAYAGAVERLEPEWVDADDARLDVVAPDLLPVKAGLDRMLEEVAGEAAGYNRLPLNRQALADPGSLVAWDRRLSLALADVEPESAIARLVCEVLSVPCPAVPASPAGKQSLPEFAAAIASANARVRNALAIDRTQAFADAKALLQSTATRRTLLDRPNARAGIRAMRIGQSTDSAQLLEVFDRLIGNALRAPDVPSRTSRRIPAALAAIVEGVILDFAEVDGSYVVVGGAGPNTYRMDRLYAVVDAGGDDQYSWGGELPLETQTVVDLSGNDRYEAALGGPGAGWLGVAILIDGSGDDRYASALGGCGAGIHGFGLLLDRSGNDSYRCDSWSSGTGIYGAGVLVDSGSGADAYVSHSLSQGVGGPAGAGMLVDGGGNDLYRANGPVRSTYDTPAVYMSFSQGVGFGIRPYDHGGFGALLDFGGNDRYEGGEFSQGGGYHYGVGLLHDASGNDFYYGNRYAQGFGCHQAAGLLTDLEGDDVYWAMTSVAQGAAWDQSVGLLFDGAGNDVYRAEALAQGAAAQQSRAWLHDAQGEDAYISSAASSQGVATVNGYHFQLDDPVFSLGILVDAHGEDRYSSGLGNGSSRIRFDAAATAGEGNAGLAVDE